MNSACLVPSLCSLLAAIDVDGVLSVYDLVSNSAVHDEAIHSPLGDLCRFAVPCMHSCILAISIATVVYIASDYVYL